MNIPVLSVTANTLAEGFEKALIALYNNGVRIKTQYDKPEDPPSLDATMNLTILQPLCDPMIHSAFPGGIESLREYVMEVQGVKDHWTKNLNDPSDTRWEYTYHGRLADYGIWKELINGVSKEVGPFKINQIEYVINKLCEQPYSRQAQMITWMPNLDNDCYDPPCLQSIWYRIMEDQKGVRHLNCNVRFRSNDAWGASFMNMFGFTIFNQEIIAASIMERTGTKIELGRLNWQADSYHIYGKDLAEAKARLFDRIACTDFSERSFNFNDEMIQEIYNEATEQIIDKIKKYDKEKSNR